MSIKEVVTAIPIDEVKRAGVEQIGQTIARVFEGVEDLTLEHDHREIIIRAGDVGDWILSNPPEARLPAARTLYFYDESDGTIGLGVSRELQVLAGVAERNFVSASNLLTDGNFATELARLQLEVQRHYMPHYDDEADAVVQQLRKHLGL